MTRCSVLMTAGLMLWSVASSAQLSQQKMLNSDIERQVREGRYELLETNENRFPVLVSDYRSATRKGVAILINDVSEAPLQQTALAPLVDELNQLGWDTRLLSPPPTDLMVPPLDIAPAPSEPNDSSTDDVRTDIKAPHPHESHLVWSEKAAEQHQEILIEYMQSVMASTRQLQGYRLIIAKGTSAAFLMRLYDEQALEWPDGLVIVSPYLPAYEANQVVPKKVGAISVPILDLAGAGATPWSQQTVRLRYEAARKAFQPDYRQRALALTSPVMPAMTLMAREIEGWNRSLGW